MEKIVREPSIHILGEKRIDFVGSLLGPYWTYVDQIATVTKSLILLNSCFTDDLFLTKNHFLFNFKKNQQSKKSKYQLFKFINYLYLIKVAVLNYEKVIVHNRQLVVA